MNKEINYATFLKRLGATLIDLVLIILITFPIKFLYYGGAYEIFAKNEGMFSAIGGSTNLLILILTIYLWIKYKATPGKMFFKLQLVNKDTLKSLSLTQSIIRYFSYYLSIFTLGIGFIWMIFDKKNQTLHDKLSKSIVIDTSDTKTKKSGNIAKGFAILYIVIVSIYLLFTIDLLIGIITGSFSFR